VGTAAIGCPVARSHRAAAVSWPETFKLSDAATPTDLAEPQRVLETGAQLFYSSLRYFGSEVAALP